MIINLIGNSNKLIDEGFSKFDYEDPNLHMVRVGFIKSIDSTFNSCRLFVPCQGEVIGIITTTHNEIDLYNFDKFCTKLSYRNIDKVCEINQMFKRLSDNGTIEIVKDGGNSL